MRVVVVLLLAAMMAGCAAAPKAPVATQEAGAEEQFDEGVPAEEGAEPAPEEPSGSPPSSSPPSSAPSSSKGPDAPPPPPGESPPPSPPRTWASPESATIRPGASLDDGSCTANFIFTSPDNSTVYIGTAAHCFKTSANPQSVPGCEAGTLGLGETMKVSGASSPATLVYSSWITMQALGETDADACAYNDFAVLQLSPGDYGKVSPAMKKFGGPTQLADPTKIGTLDKVLTYGNSGTRPEDSPLSPKEGYVVLSPGGGWTMSIYTVSPGIPGDSGSGVMTADGQAIGDMVTLQGFPPAGNGVSILSKELEYARLKGGFDIRLATWELLDPGLLPPL